MKTETLKFIDEWKKNKAKKAKIHLMSVCDNDHIYALEVRFSATLYKCSEEEFFGLRDMLRRRSGGVFVVTTSWVDFHAGLLSIKVAFCNHAYNDKKVAKALKMLITEIIPSFKK